MVIRILILILKACLLALKPRNLANAFLNEFGWAALGGDIELVKRMRL
jgi:hypothetical protein